MNTTSESLLFRLQQVDGRLDQTAWEEFVRLYTPLMFYWARKTGLNTADASDIVQHVITRVLEKLPGFPTTLPKAFGVGYERSRSTAIARSNVLGPVA